MPSNRELGERTAIKRHAAFVLGLQENGYGIVRSLAREGVPIVGVYSNANEFGRLSKHCESYYLAPSVERQERFCAMLIEHRAKFDARPVLFPTSDEYAFLLARNMEKLSQHFLFHWVAPDRLSRIIDKSEISEICHGTGVPVPRTYAPRVEDDLAKQVSSFPFPCLIKPNSYAVNFPAGTKNFIARSPMDLLEFYEKRPWLKGATLWQEIIEGDDDNIFQCTMLIRESGELGPLSCTRKTHQYPPGYGIMVFGHSEHNHEVVTLSSKLVGLLHYRGLASLEFKYRPKDGRYYFIEINPRLPWYNALFVDAGINLPYFAYLDLIGGSHLKTVQPSQRDGVYWIHLKLELGWFLETRRKHGTKLFQWLKSIAKARSYAWFDWRDPKPFLRSALDLFLVALRQLLGKKKHPLNSQTV